MKPIWSPRCHCLPLELVTVPNNYAKKKPFQPVRPEGSPRPAYRRQVVKKHVQIKTQTLTVQDLPPCPDEMVWDVFNSEAEQVMAYMKAKLISVTQELKLIKSGAKMDAQALEEKNAKVRLRKKVEKFIQEICLMKVDSDLWEMIRDNEEEEEEEERIKEVRRNGEESSVASKPKETATRYTVSKPKEVKKGLNMEEKKEDRQVVLKRRFGMSAVNSKLKQCEHCGRCFDPSRLEKHSEIYAKLSSKSSRRGVYDSTMHRLKGTVLAGYVKRSVM
ncbi:zinc finger C2HC domain-containing protein 1C-like [Salmo trutta]|uniref:zinc finger C2HC domain-containing protein 1C-like n=1 Tax=Salmo trutta TaxID=8032 RepID=UPI001131FFA6|nr:zinc finger C2HC domain-containing protein 1C-like [Salmo trutta]